MNALATLPPDTGGKSRSVAKTLAVVRDTLLEPYRVYQDILTADWLKIAISSQSTPIDIHALADPTSHHHRRVLDTVTHRLTTLPGAPN